MNNDFTINSAVIVSIAATCISVFTTIIITHWVSRKDKERNLDDQLDNILKISIQYPYLESSVFTVSWKPALVKDDEKYQRYDLYAILVFNFLSRYAEYHKYNKRKMEKDLDVRDWVRHHRNYWKDPETPFENADGYAQPFKNLINEYLN